MATIVIYGNLSSERKKGVDEIYHTLYQSLRHSYKINKERFNRTMLEVLDYETTETQDFRSKLGNWLIDNRLNLVFSQVFGHHEALRADLMSLHAYRDGLIDGDEVSFGKEHPIDEEYKEYIYSVLFDQRNLYKHPEFGMLKVSEYFPLKVSDFFAAEENKLLKELQENKDKIVRCKNLLLEKVGITTWSDFMYVTDNGVYFFQDNDVAIIQEVAVIQPTIKAVIDVYNDLYSL